MTIDSRAPRNTIALVAFIVSLCSLVPVIAVTLIGLAVTSYEAQLLADNPGTMSMISSDFADWANLVWGGITFGIPAAGTALGLGIWSLRRPGRRVLGIIGIAISSVVIVLGVIGAVTQ